MHDKCRREASTGVQSPTRHTAQGGRRTNSQRCQVVAARCWRERQVNDCQANEDHPSGWLHQRGLCSIPTGRLLKHNPVTWRHHSSHEHAQHPVRRRRESRARGGRGSRARGHPAHERHRAVRRAAARVHEAAVDERECASVLHALQRVSAQRLGAVLSRPARAHRLHRLLAHRTGHSAHTCQDHRHCRDQLLVQESQLPVISSILFSGIW